MECDETFRDIEHFTKNRNTAQKGCLEFSGEIGCA